MEEVVLTKKAIKFFEMEAGLKTVSNAPGFKFSILLEHNLKTLKDKLDIIRDKSKYCEEFEKALKETEKIREKYVNKNKDGQPIIVNKSVDGEMRQAYDIPEEKITKLNKALEDFWEKEENKTVREKQNQIFEDYSKFIEEEDLTVTLYAIPESVVPSEYFNDPANIPALKRFTATCLDLFKE